MEGFTPGLNDTHASPPEGKTDRLAGKAKEKAGDAKDKVDDLTDKVKDAVKSD